MALTSFQFNLEVTSPATPGAAARYMDGFPILEAGAYTAEGGGLFPLTGAGTLVVSLGVIAPAGVPCSLLIVSMEEGLEPVTVAYGAGSFTLTKGGCFVLKQGLDNPQDVQNLSLTYTADATLRVLALG
mgnify:FL=1|jgi:hypothetical protein